MTGIYAIKNKINDKIYMGRSTDINRRWKSHLRDAKNGDLCKIHVAMRKLGIENFYIEVVEECPVEELNEKEQYYIDKFDSWHNGYNNGNSSNFLDGERNPNAKMTEQEIKEIRIRRSYLIENRREIYKDYKDKTTWLILAIYVNIKPGLVFQLNLILQKLWSGIENSLGNECRKFSMEELEEIVRLRYKEGLSYQKQQTFTISIEKRLSEFLLILTIKMR